MTSIYTLTIFTSAFLLFLVQPMISKLLLPHLGGSPAVWNTSMMVFQALLLAGYAYAHITSKWLGAKRQAWLHLALLAVTVAWLPVAVKTELGFASVEQPVLWVIVSLLLSVGLPFFALAANAPLLQFWLANTSHKDAKNPYFLYSASNIGSLLALCSYPLLVEPMMTLQQQTSAWSNVFILFIVLIAGCVWFMRRRFRPVGEIHNGMAVKPATKDRLRWVLLAFFPSSLLLGVTTYITTDIASLPLFWVGPLAIYLLTFILAFAREPLMVDRALNAQMMLVPLTAMALAFEMNFLTQVLIIHLFAFFAVAMGCHGTLARLKPDSRYLTEYFLWISFGGMLGGVFNSLVAPLAFTNPVEYPLILALSLFMRPDQSGKGADQRAKLLDFVIPAAFALLLWLALKGSHWLFTEHAAWVTSINASLTSLLAPGQANMVNLSLMPLLAALLFLCVAGMAYITYKRPVRFALVIAMLLVIVPFSGSAPSSKYMPNVIYAERNFFGVNRVLRSPQSGAMLLMHGTTLHGMQSLDPQNRLQPVSYYGALKEVFAHLSPKLKGQPAAVLGLGAGTLACLGQPGQPFDFYEIDPIVAAIAQNKEFFTYLSDCKSKSVIYMGDGRLTLARADDQRYAIMVMDAFSSDSIPVHLVTREALKVYMSKLAKGGILAFNISNRHLNLAPVMAALAEDAGLKAMIKITLKPAEKLTQPSMWVVMAHDTADFHGLQKDNPQWKTLENTGKTAVWTDNYSNILETIR